MSLHVPCCGRPMKIIKKYDMKYSIITPLYNSFDLMDRYFDSLLHQTKKDFEVIIVDDCSTDGSWEKLQSFVNSTALDIKICQTEKNSGPGNARNLGVDIATGDWITFVDNDDWISTDLFDKIDYVLVREDVNCVIYDYYTCFNDVTNIAHSMYDGKEGVKTLSECINFVRNHTFCKFYKRLDVVNVRFPLVRRCEDVAYVLQAIVACGNAYYLKQPLYYYRQRPASLSNNSKMDHLDMVNAFAILEDKYLNIYPLEMKNKSIMDVLYGGGLMMCKAGKSNTEILNYIEEYETKYLEWWKCEIIQYIGIAKQVFLQCAKWHFVLGMKLIAYIHSLMVKRGA